MTPDDALRAIDALGAELKDPTRRAVVIARAHDGLVEAVEPEAKLFATMVAQALLDEDSVHEARSLFERLAALDPDEPHYRDGLAHCEVRQGRCEEAIAALTQTIEGEPKNVQARLDRGQAYRRLGRDLEAAEDYRQALRIGVPKQAAPAVRLSLSLITPGRRR